MKSLINSSLVFLWSCWNCSGQGLKWNFNACRCWEMFISVAAWATCSFQHCRPFCSPSLAWARGGCNKVCCPGLACLLSVRQEFFCGHWSWCLLICSADIESVPHGSILGPILLSLCMPPPAFLIWQFIGISLHCYVDDMQLYISFKSDDLSKLSTLQDCLMATKDWISDIFLQLNTDKTEVSHHREHFW